jgi:GTPase SAR1 family protein
MIGLLGEPGIGKTTTMVQICHKEFGDDGYIIFNCGKEQGIDAINNAIYEDIEDWKKFDEVTKDIIKNKKTDYPNLKVVVIDSIDTMLDISSAETIRRWNAENMGKKGFEPAKTLAQSWNGFSGPLDYNLNLVLDKFWELKKAGVQVWIIGHVKTKELIDPITGTTYSTITTDMSQRDFNAFKNKFHLVGIAYIDRAIETENTGRKNIITHKDVTVNKVKSENRRISFRDDQYVVDSKSRFPDIVPDIPMDADAFIKAVKDAIRAARKNDSTPAPAVTEPAPTPKPETVVEEKEEVPFDENVPPMNEPEEVPEGEYPDGLVDIILSEYKTADDDKKSKVKVILKEHGTKVKDASEDVLQELYDILCR